MKNLKNPKINAFLVSVVSGLYALLFIFTSNHTEFIRLLSHPKTLNSAFWNRWSAFVQGGNMKYIGYAIIALAVAIICLTVFRRQRYDEYQVNILAKGFIAAGIVTVLMLPVALLLILSDRSYAIETMFLLLTVQWFGVLIVDLIYTAKYFKQ